MLDSMFAGRAWKPLSRTFVAAVKLSDRPQYQIAFEAGIHPSTLSRLLHAAERIAPNDRRVLAVARVLGLTADQCFTENH
jgi:hypothetical protein